MTDEKRVLIDDPAVSDPDWIKRVEERRRQRALTAALKASRLKTPTN
jgi:hypothetical protein